MQTKSLRDVKTRSDFEEAFHSAMSGAHERLRAFWHFEKDQNLPKSYLIEFHPHHNGSTNHEWTSDAVYKALKKTGRYYGSQVQRTKDESLLYLQHYEQSHAAEFIVDCLDPRFLTFHTISNATSTDRFIVDRLTQYQPEFDLFWLPVALLMDVENREQVTGWEALFNPLIDDVEFTDSEAADSEGESDREHDPFSEIESALPTRELKRPRLNIHLEWPNALEKYKSLKATPSLFPDVPLDSVQAERYDESGVGHVKARIKSHGKITGRGTDFSTYLHIVNGTLDSYASLIRQLESKYWIGLKTHDEHSDLGFKVKGEPFCLSFSFDVDVRQLIKLMFSCLRPFRLMGEPERLGNDYFAIDAIDLHVNQRLAFEIAPRLMRIYLYEGTCGNTLVRIIRSLQHFVDSNLTHPSLFSDVALQSPR